MITVVCFLEDVEQAFREARRILKDHGALIIGFIERNSELGKQYSLMAGQDGFFRDARFYSAEMLEACLAQAGFTGFAYRQTLFPEGAGTQEVEEGYGRGSFVFLKAIKNQEDMQT
jgi:hypothetical protein